MVNVLEEILLDSELLSTTIKENIRFGGISEFEPLIFKLKPINLKKVCSLFEEVNSLKDRFQNKIDLLLKNNLFYGLSIHTIEYPDLDLEENEFIKIEVFYDFVDTKNLKLIGSNIAYSQIETSRRFSFVKEYSQGPIESGYNIYQL